MSGYEPIGTNGSDHLIAFDERTVDRGSDYADQGRIVGLTWSDDELLLTGLCRGSGGHSYHTSIEFTGHERTRRLDSTECSCPVGYFCKHAVALLLTAFGEEPTPADLPVPVAHSEPDPLGILVELPPSHRYAPNPAPTLRLVRRGSSGRWVKTGINWRTVLATASGAYSASTTHGYQPEQARAVIAIARAVADDHRREGGRTAEQEACPVRRRRRTGRPLRERHQRRGRPRPRGRRLTARAAQPPVGRVVPSRAQPLVE